MQSLDIEELGLREVNSRLHQVNDGKFEILNPRGLHNIAVGLDAPLDVTVRGHVGAYCAGMNKHANVTIEGNAGPGLAENIMSGKVHVRGYASQAVGATGHGGLIVVEGDATADVIFTPDIIARRFTHVAEDLAEPRTARLRRRRLQLW